VPKSIRRNKNLPCGRNGIPPEANQVEYVICPARIDDAVAEKARAIALHVSEKFNHVGLWLLKCSKLKTMKF
jgi:5-(carboxyamino)imidazole ribonucleotide synthase